MVRSIILPPSAGAQRNHFAETGTTEPMSLGSEDNLPSRRDGASPAGNDVAPPQPGAGGVSAIIKRFNSGGGSPRLDGHVGAVQSSSSAKAPYSPKKGSAARMIATASATIVTPEPPNVRSIGSPPPSLAQQVTSVPEKSANSHAVTPPLDRKWSVSGKLSKSVEPFPTSVATTTTVDTSAQCRGQLSQRNNRISGMIAAFEKTGSNNSLPSAALTRSKVQERAKAAVSTESSVPVPSASQHSNEKATATRSSYPKASKLDGASRMPNESKLPISPTQIRSTRHKFFTKTHPDGQGGSDGIISSPSDVAASTAETSGLFLGLSSHAKSYQVGIQGKDFRHRFAEGTKITAPLPTRQESQGSANPCVTSVEVPSSPSPMSAGASKLDFGDLSPIRDEGGESASAGNSPARQTRSTQFKLSESRHKSDTSLFQSRLVQFSKSLKDANTTVETRKMSTKYLRPNLPNGTSHSVESTEETTETSSIDEESRVLSHDLSADDTRQLEDWKEEGIVPLASLCDVSADKLSSSNDTSPSKPVSASKVNVLKSRFDVSIATATTTAPSSLHKEDTSQEGFEVAASNLSDLSVDISQRASRNTLSSLLREEGKIIREDGEHPPAEQVTRRDIDSRRPITLSLQARKPSNGDGPPSALGTGLESHLKQVGDMPDGVQFGGNPVSENPDVAVEIDSTMLSTLDFIANARMDVPIPPQSDDVEPPLGPPTPIRVTPNSGILQTTDLSFLSSSRVQPSSAVEGSLAVVAADPRASNRGPTLFKLAPNPKDTALPCKAKKRRGPNCDDSQGACPLSSTTGRATSPTKEQPMVDYTSVSVPLRAQPSRFAPDPASLSSPMVAKPELTIRPLVTPTSPERVSVSVTAARSARSGPVDLDVTVEDSMEVAKSTCVDEDVAAADVHVNVEHLMEVLETTSVDKDVEAADVEDVQVPDDITESVEGYSGAENSPRRIDSVIPSPPTARIRKLAPSPKDTAHSMRSIHRTRQSSLSDGEVSASPRSPTHSTPYLLQPPVTRSPEAARDIRTLSSSWNVVSARGVVSQTNPIWTTMDGAERVKRWRKFRRRQRIDDYPESSFDEYESSTTSEQDPSNYRRDSLLNSRGRVAAESQSLGMASYDDDQAVAAAAAAVGSSPRNADDGYHRTNRQSKKSPRASASSSVMIEI